MPQKSGSAPRVGGEESPLWKDRVNPALMRALGEAIAGAWSPFPVEQWLETVVAAGAFSLELKDRMAVASRALGPLLPPFREAAPVLVAAAPGQPMWAGLVLTGFVEIYGIEDPDVAVSTLAELTKHGTAEISIRPFIHRDPEHLLPTLHRWAADPDEHVRRLAAEGTRPRGVWVMHLPAFRRDPRPVVALLDRLRADPSLYVRKAVANNLNDISRDHPDIALATAARWRRDDNPRTNWIIERALRSLLKAGDAEAHAIVGRPQGVAVQVEAFHAEPSRIAIGDHAEFSAMLRSHADVATIVAVTLRVWFQKVRGTSPKVFDMGRVRVAPAGVLSVSLRRSFADHSTRTHRPGPHRVEILVNGVPSGEVVLDLVAAA